MGQTVDCEPMPWVMCLVASRPLSSVGSVLFSRTPWHLLTGAPCRDPAHDQSSHSCRSRGHQIPSESDAPRHFPLEPEHLPPQSPASSASEPPRTNRIWPPDRALPTLIHMLRCMLGPHHSRLRTASARAARRPSASVNCTFPEHTTSNINSDLGLWPAACVG